MQVGVILPQVNLYHGNRKYECIMSSFIEKLNKLTENLRRQKQEQQEYHSQQMKKCNCKNKYETGKKGYYNENGNFQKTETN